MAPSDDLRGVFKRAAEIAAEAPEYLREIAYQRALDALLGARTQLAAVPPVVPTPAPKHSLAPKQTERPADDKRMKGGHSAEVTRLLEALNRTELAPLLRGRKVLDRALLLLQAASNHEVDALSAADISTLLTVKFREATTPSAVRMALDRNTQFTDRRPNGALFLYSLMAPGEEYLKSLSAVGSAVPMVRAGPVRRPKSVPKSSAPSKRAESSRASATAHPLPATRRKGSGRPGPMAALEALVSEGYFAKARTMSEFLRHLQEKRTLAYKATDMTAPLQRLVRKDTLTREKNAEGQYEYSTAKPTS